MIRRRGILGWFSQQQRVTFWQDSQGIAVVLKWILFQPRSSRVCHHLFCVFGDSYEGSDKINKLTCGTEEHFLRKGRRLCSTCQVVSASDLQQFLPFWIFRFLLCFYLNMSWKRKTLSVIIWSKRPFYPRFYTVLPFSNLRHQRGHFHLLYFAPLALQLLSWSWASSNSYSLLWASWWVSCLSNDGKKNQTDTASGVFYDERRYFVLRVIFSALPNPSHTLYSSNWSLHAVPPARGVPMKIELISHGTSIERRSEIAQSRPSFAEKHAHGWKQDTLHGHERISNIPTENRKQEIKTRDCCHQSQQ